MPSSSTASFFSLTRPELTGYCAELGLAAVHAKNMFRGAYKFRLQQPWEQDGIPRHAQKTFGECFRPLSAQVAKAMISRYDQSVKFLIQFNDGALVETVLMPETRRLTLCLSSQVGCAQGCVFCHTGRMGLNRNLDASEIVAQVLLVNRWITEHPEWVEAVRLKGLARVSNIVFMGMGEPLDNASQTIKALQILSDPLGLGIAMRRISVSTAGHLEGLQELWRHVPRARVAFSLHAPDEATRTRLMPINRRWPLAEVLSVLREHYRESPDFLMVQYTLIHGVNDGMEQAEMLARLLVGIPVKINLIPFNEIGPARFRSPEVDAVESFRQVLQKSGYRVLVRYSKGQDIAAACGQLVV